MRLRDIGFLLSAFICFVIFLLPLKLISGLLPQENIRLIGFEGELHQGQIANVYLKKGAQWVDLGSLDWQLHFASLFRLAPTFQLNGGNAGFNYNGEVSFSGSAVTASDFSAKAPAEMFKPFIQLPVNVRGQFAVDIAELNFNRKTNWFDALQGQMSVMDGAVGIGGPAFTLGDYGIRFQLNEQNQLTGQLQHLAGPLIANGQFTLQQQGRFDLQAELEQGTGLDKQVWQTLQMVAKPQGNKLKLDYQTSL